MTTFKTPDLPRVGFVSLGCPKATVDSEHILTRLRAEGYTISGSYDDALAAVPDVDVFTSACPEFVDYVERGITSGPEIVALAREYLAPLQAADVDTLILGCTHYPLLTGALGYVLGDDVTMVSSAEESAKEVFTTLTDMGLVRAEPRPVSRRFLTTGSPAMFEGIGRRLMGGFVEGVEQVVPATLRA